MVLERYKIYMKYKQTDAVENIPTTIRMRQLKIIGLIIEEKRLGQFVTLRT